MLPQDYTLSNITLIIKSLCLNCRALHGQTLAYVADLLPPYSSARSLRPDMLNLLSVPCTCIKTCGDWAFEVITPKLWNTLPAVCLLIQWIHLKKELKTHLFRQVFGWPVCSIFMFSIVYFYCVLRFRFALFWTCIIGVHFIYYICFSFCMCIMMIYDKCYPNKM